MHSSSSFKLSSLKGSVARQRKVSVSENVICAFKNALLSGLLRDYNMHGSSTTAATFSTPAKRKFQRSVKKIMMQNAVAKVTSLLTQHDADKTPAVPPAVTDPKSGVKRPARRRTLGALTEDNRRKSYMGPAATDLHRPVLPAPSSRSKLRMTDLQQDSSSIEKEVIMTEKVIEAFHAAVLNSLDANISKETKCESYKTSVKAVPTALAASSKTRWQRSIKKVMLQKAVEKVSDMLSHSAVEKNSSHTADEVVHTDQGPAKIKSCADGHLVHVPDIHSRSGAPSTLKTENLSSAPIISKEMFRSRSAAAAPKQAKTQTRVIEKEDSLRLFPIL